MQELMQKYHSLYMRMLFRHSNTCVTEQIYKLTEYLFQPYVHYNIKNDYTWYNVYSTLLEYFLP